MFMVMSASTPPAFSFVILVYNEGLHIARLLHSIKSLEAPIYVLDSGSTDRTLQICSEYSVCVDSNVFENHPKQWDYALKRFPINTPWIIALDADQIVTPELFIKLK